MPKNVLRIVVEGFQVFISMDTHLIEKLFAFKFSAPCIHDVIFTALLPFLFDDLVIQFSFLYLSIWQAIHTIPLNSPK